MNKMFLTLILMFSVLGTESFSKDWNGIVPCVSTRSEVEKKIGSDDYREPGLWGSYRYKKLSISIYYEKRDKALRGTDIVTYIEVNPDPNKSMPLAKYVKNIPNFSKEFRKREMDPKITHIRYLAHYFNAAEGFEITVQKNDDDIEVIDSFGYYGLDSDCSKLPPASPASSSTKF